MKKTVKKAVSAVLVFAFVIAALCLPAGAQDDISEYPAIMVAGYSASALVLEKEDGTTEQVWQLQGGNILDMVTGYVGRIIAGLGLAVLEKPDYLAKIVGEGAQGLLEYMKCNPDGSSMYNVRPMLNTAEECNSALMLERFGDYSYQHETEIMGDARDLIGAEKTYDFNCDFRMGAVENAKRLDDFIQQVKRHSGSDKVNIIAVSHGGQVTGTYLSLFGYKRDVNNCVMTVPALGGAALIYDALTENVVFDEKNLLNFIENGNMLETDYHWLVEAEELGFLDSFIKAVFPYIYEIIGNWCSIWDFCPTEIYEEMKAKWLDPVANAALIRKSDYMHYSVMPTFTTALQKCNSQYGMHVSIIAGVDNRATTGLNYNTDGIIHTASSTGATCAPWGERFADGYVQKNSCGGKYKVSPAMTIDASTAYLPDNTWFVSGLFHGMTFKDPFSRELMMELLLKDRIKDVYSDPAYPQFHYSTNPCYAVSARFNKSAEGYVSSDDNSIIIRNLSLSNKTVKILGITCEGLDLKFRMPLIPIIKAGEELEIPFTGDIPAVSASRAGITVSYNVYGTATPVGERYVPFTVQNGEKPDYSGGFAGAAAITPLDRLLPEGMINILKAAKLYTFFSMFYTIFYTAMNSIFAIAR